MQVGFIFFFLFIFQNYSFSYCFTRVWNLVSHLKGQTEADGELQKDAEEDIFA